MPSVTRPSKRFAPIVLACGLLTAGCYQGANGTVNLQPPSGNGTFFEVPAADGTAADQAGMVLVQGANIVAAQSGDAALSLTMINTTEVDDALVGITTAEGASAQLSAPVEVKADSAVQVGGPQGVAVPITGLGVKPGEYAPLVLSFRNAGVSTPQQVLVVPNVGYYQSYGPSPSPTPSATEEQGKVRKAKE